MAIWVQLPLVSHKKGAKRVEGTQRFAPPWPRLRTRTKTRLDRQGNSIRDTGSGFRLTLGQRFAFWFSLGFGEIAQLVEQRTENPCVPGSIPGLATTQTPYPAMACEPLRGARSTRPFFSWTVLGHLWGSTSMNSVTLCFWKTRGNGDPLDLKLKFFSTTGGGGHAHPNPSFLLFITTRTTFFALRLPCPPPRNRKSCRRDNWQLWQLRQLEDGLASQRRSPIIKNEPGKASMITNIFSQPSQ